MRRRKVEGFAGAPTVQVVSEERTLCPPGRQASSCGHPGDRTTQRKLGRILEGSQVVDDRAAIADARWVPGSGSRTCPLAGIQLDGGHGAP